MRTEKAANWPRCDC